MAIFKLQSGLIFSDTFESADARWNFSPSGSCTVTNNQLLIEHNDTEETKALFYVPQEQELLFEVSADYFPSEFGDEGGILIWNSAHNKLEFLERMDGIRTDEYTTWRAVKKGKLWTFYANRNGQWELFDSSVLEAHMMGVVLKGPNQTNFTPLTINRAVLCKGTAVTVGNLGIGSKVVLTDENGIPVKEQIVPSGYTGIQVELPTIPFKGKITIFQNSVQVSHMNLPVEFFGGDVYMFGTDLTVLWKGLPLDMYGPTSLGDMKNGAIEEQMVLKNDSTSDTAQNIIFSVKQYLDEFGWRWVDIAVDSNGVPGTYGDQLTLGTLNPGESVPFWVKVTKNNNDWATKPTHFMFDIQHN